MTHVAIANTTLYADAERRRRAAERLAEPGPVASRSAGPEVAP